MSIHLYMKNITQNIATMMREVAVELRRPIIVKRFVFPE